MKVKELLRHHKLFVVFLVLFLIVGAIDLLNLDRVSYKALCEVVAPISGSSSCPPYYDIPIWSVYLSLAMLAALYHVHDEIRTSNRHLSHKH